MTEALILPDALIQYEFMSTLVVVRQKRICRDFLGGYKFWILKKLLRLRMKAYSQERAAGRTIFSSTTWLVCGHQQMESIAQCGPRVCVHFTRFSVLRNYVVSDEVCFAA